MENSNFSGWAVVDLFGHTQITGYVTTEYFGTACMFRVDVPELPERETVMNRPGYANSQWVPAGTKVQTPAEPGRTKLIGPGAVYAMNPCSEEIARQKIENDRALPVIVLELPEGYLPAPVDAEFKEVDEDYDPDNDEHGNRGI